MKETCRLSVWRRLVSRFEFYNRTTISLSISMCIIMLFKRSTLQEGMALQHTLGSFKINQYRHIIPPKTCTIFLSTGLASALQGKQSLLSSLTFLLFSFSVAFCCPRTPSFAAFPSTPLLCVAVSGSWFKMKKKPWENPKKGTWYGMISIYSSSTFKPESFNAADTGPSFNPHLVSISQLYLLPPIPVSFILFFSFLFEYSTKCLEEKYTG